MSVSPNGVALRPPSRAPVIAFSVIPKPVPVEVERANRDRASEDDPETVTVTLQAWDRYTTHPAEVDIEVEAVLDVFREALHAEEQWIRAQESPPERRVPLEQATLDMRRGLLMAVIPGLTAEEAGGLVHDRGPWADILSALHWWRQDTAAAESPAPDGDDDEADDRPEGAGEPATITGGSSPVSAPSTAPTPGRP